MLEVTMESVNKIDVDTLTPPELMDIIELKSVELQAALTALAGWKIPFGSAERRSG